jgi:hypothetical protein
MDQTRVDSWPLIVLTTEPTGSVTVRGQAAAACGNRSEGAGRCDPYCEWHWDGVSLVAETDRYGFFPLFYYAWDKGIMLSPSLDALLEAGAPRQIDDAAVAVLLRRWTCVGQDTPFEHIRIFPPGGRLTWIPGKPVQVEKRYVFGRPTSLTRSAALDGYIEYFRQSVRRRAATGASIVPLSGGRDSRHIFLELCDSGRPPDVAVTVAGVNQTTPDSEIAAALASRAGVQHVTLNIPESRWRSQTEVMRETHYCTLEHWWLESLVSYVRKFDPSVSVYEGVAGDVLSTAIFKEERLRRLYDQGKLAQVADLILDPEFFFEQSLSRKAYQRFGRDIAIERLVTELEEHAAAPNPLASFFVYNRSRRVTALPPATLLSPYATVWCPYLDTDVWDHLSSLPPEYLEGGSVSAFHDEAITRAYPKFADIPFVARLDVRPRKRSYELRTIADMARAIVKKPPAMMRTSFLLPRLVRGVIDPSFTQSATALAPLVGYAIELEARMDSAI